MSKNTTFHLTIRCYVSACHGGHGVQLNIPISAHVDEDGHIVLETSVDQVEKDYYKDAQCCEKMELEDVTFEEWAYRI